MPVSRLDDPGFVGNAPDGTSCLHACVQMLLRVKEGAPVYDFAAIDRLLRRKPGLYAWPYALYPVIAEAGFRIERFSTFSVPDFVARGEAYLIDYYGPEMGEDQIRKSDIPTVLDDARRFLAADIVQHHARAPEIDDIRAALRNGGYVMPFVNSRILEAAPGMNAHAVLVYGHDEEGVFLHDPGPPPLPSRKVPWALFAQAWTMTVPEKRSMHCFYPLGRTGANKFMRQEQHEGRLA